MQVERRRNPYPLTWEIPAGVLAASVLLLVLGVHFGRALANWFADAGWHWTTPTALFSSLPAVLGGDGDAGLSADLLVAASPSQVLVWVVTTEAVILGFGMTIAVVALRRWGPGRLKGMATPADAEAALGMSRLRRICSVIRPDLYLPFPGRPTHWPTRRRHPRSAHT